MKILLLAPLVEARGERRPTGFLFGLVEAFEALGHTVTTVQISGEPLYQRRWDRSKINCREFVDEVISKSREHDTVFISKGSTIEMPWYRQIARRCEDTTFFDMDPTSGNGCGPPNRPKIIGARGLLCTRIIATGTEALRWFRQNGFTGRQAQIYEGYRPWLWPTQRGPRRHKQRITFLGSRGYAGDGGRRKKLDAIEAEGYELVQNNRTHFEEAASAYYHSAICPNFVCGDITSLRVLHILASKGFCLTEYNVDVQASFNRGDQLDWFVDQKEMFEKINFYLKRPMLRNEIARRGYRWAKDYTWEHQAEKMIRFIQGESVCDGGAGEYIS